MIVFVVAKCSNALIFSCLSADLFVARMEVPLGAGSGFIWDDKGHIVTNYHVVRSAKSAQVAVLTRVFRDETADTSTPRKTTLFGRSRNKSNSAPASKDDQDVTDYTRSVYKARIVGFDPDKDVAVLKIDAPVFDLIPIEVGLSKGLKVGQEALAIGKTYFVEDSCLRKKNLPHD